MAAAIDMYYSVMSYKQIAENLEKTQDMPEPSKATVYEWVRDYSHAAVDAMKDHPAHALIGTGWAWAGLRHPQEPLQQRLWILPAFVQHQVVGHPGEDVALCPVRLGQTLELGGRDNMIYGPSLHQHRNSRHRVVVGAVKGHFEEGRRDSRRPNRAVYRRTSSSLKPGEKRSIRARLGVAKSSSGSRERHTRAKSKGC